MFASTLAKSVSTTPAPLSDNSSRKCRCLRAEALMLASRYRYQPLQITLDQHMANLRVDLLTDTYRPHIGHSMHPGKLAIAGITGASVSLGACRTLVTLPIFLQWYKTRCYMASIQSISNKIRRYFDMRSEVSIRLTSPHITIMGCVKTFRNSHAI